MSPDKNITIAILSESHSPHQKTTEKRGGGTGSAPAATGAAKPKHLASPGRNPCAAHGTARWPPYPSPPLLACFADRWTITGEHLDGDKRTALSLSAWNRDGSTAPGESREIRYAPAAHAAAFVTLRVVRKSMVGRGTQEWAHGNRVPGPTGEGEHDGDRGALALVRNERSSAPAIFA